MRLLLVNPNTSTHITERLMVSARQGLAKGDVLTAVTATEGPEVVRSADHLALAEQNVLSLVARNGPGHDAIVLGISLDGAVRRLRHLFPEICFVGMTEAALMCACLRTERIGLLTLGSSLLPLYRQRVDEIGLASRVVALEAAESTTAFAPDTTRVDQNVLNGLVSGGERLRESGAQSIVLAGAVLCGYSAALASACAMPVFDGIEAAVGQARVLAAQVRRER